MDGAQAAAKQVAINLLATLKGLRLCARACVCMGCSRDARGAEAAGGSLDKVQLVKLTAFVQVRTAAREAPLVGVFLFGPCACVRDCWCVRSVWMGSHRNRWSSMRRATSSSRPWVRAAAQPLRASARAPLFARAWVGAGERGRHSRSAVGVNALPLNVPVEIEAVAMVVE